MQVPLFEAHFDDAKREMIRVSKVLLIPFPMILLVTSPKKFKNLVIVTAMSFGVLAIKGAIFGVRTGGGSPVWGPPHFFISHNNAFALSVNMSLPRLLYLDPDDQQPPDTLLY